MGKDERMLAVLERQAELLGKIVHMYEGQNKKHDELLGIVKSADDLIKSNIRAAEELMKIHVKSLADLSQDYVKSFNETIRDHMKSTGEIASIVEEHNKRIERLTQDINRLSGSFINFITAEVQWDDEFSKG
jgi:hypothetical protein